MSNLCLLFRRIESVGVPRTVFLDTASLVAQVVTMSTAQNPRVPLDVDAVVIGGGMVGLTLAAALGSAGVSVAIVERQSFQGFTGDVHDGRSSAIAAGSRRVLEAIGLWGAVANAAEPILEIRVSDGGSPLFLHYDHEELGAGPLGYIVENRELIRAMLARTVGLETVEVLDGRTIETVERDAVRATVRLEGGECLRARVVFAADGRNSPVRRGAGIGVVEWRYPQSGIVCTVAHSRPHEGVAQERFLPAGPFAILPMTGRRSSIVWTERDELAPAFMALDDASFTEELSLRFGDYLGDLEVVGPRFCYPLALTHAEAYTAPRLALVGDAAHGMHPIAGQGFNLGVRDLAALAEVTVDALRLGLDPGSSTVLDRYQRWRRFDNLVMLAVTDSLNRMFSNEIPPVRLARDLGLAAVNRLPPLKRLFMRHAMGAVGDLPRLVRGMPL